MIHFIHFFKTCIMIKVRAHGDRVAVYNPVTRKEQDMTKVVFSEDARGGANSRMKESSDALSDFFGENVGFEGLPRTHTHLVKTDQLSKFPIHRDFGGESDFTLPLFINRGLFSKPQMEAQRNVQGREIDGRLTYFATWIGKSQEDDIDERLSEEALIELNPNSVLNAQVRATEVRILDKKALSGVDALS
jgi:hypothetical protein